MKRRPLRFRVWLLWLAAVFTGTAVAQSLDPPVSAPAPLSAAAQAIYQAARARLFQIRTLVATAGEQSSIGSGFLVSSDGLALTNYHVVSQFALEPSTYRLEYLSPDGRRGSLTVLAIDVVNDLAAIRIDRGGDAFFSFDPRAVRGKLPNGERLFSLGNPLDLGFTIVEGTYNGFVDRSYTARMHFSGAINPGMSGGPTVTQEGRIAGINVAKRLDGELVSFLVPAEPAAALVERARNGAPLSVEAARAEIARQIDHFQSGLLKALDSSGFKSTPQGPYRVPESQAPWLQCWARTNADATPRPRALISTTACNTQTSVFIADDLSTGTVELSYSHVESVSLNDFQFAALLSERAQPSQFEAGPRRRTTRQTCHEDFLRAADDPAAPLLRATLCARAYRDFPGIYDIAATALTKDDPRNALVARLTVRGVDWTHGVAFVRRYLTAIRRTP